MLNASGPGNGRGRGFLDLDVGCGGKAGPPEMFVLGQPCFP